MDKILDMIALWDRFGQFLFFAFLAMLTLGSVLGLFKLLVVLLRGWPTGDEAEDIL